jgi:hypothetical protein
MPMLSGEDTTGNALSEHLDIATMVEMGMCEEEGSDA